MDEILKTSTEWNKKYQYSILDPDGWDRGNFHYSFTEELINEQEFFNRINKSTIERNSKYGFAKAS